MVKKSLVCTLLILMWIPAYVSAEPASKESVKAFMEQSGSGEIGIQMVNQLLPMLKKIAPDASEKFWDDFAAQMDAKKVVEMIIPIYQKYFDGKDIQELTAFYKTEVGKKLIRVQPKIMQESMVVGQAWGSGIASDVFKKYKAEYSK